MATLKKIVVLIPSYNEEKTLVRLLHKINKKYRTLVVDDGSTDNTFVKVRKLCSHYLKHSKNMGYQKTIENGIKFAMKKKYDGVITFDADEQFGVTDIKKFYQSLKKGFDLVLGIRSFFPRISERIFNTYTNKKFKVEDILCGMKAYNLKSINKNILKQNFYGCPNIALDYIKRKKKIKKIYVNVYERKEKSKFGNILIGNLKILLDLIKLFNLR